MLCFTFQLTASACVQGELSARIPCLHAVPPCHSRRLAGRAALLLQLCIDLQYETTLEADLYNTKLPQDVLESLVPA